MQQLFPDSEHLHWNSDNDNFKALATSDILITDFSAIMIEYSMIFGKPFIYADTSFSPAPYDAAWFDEPIWHLKVIGQLGVPLEEKSFPVLKQVIQKTITSTEFKTNIKKISDEAWQNKGKAATAVVEYLTREEK